MAQRIEIYWRFLRPFTLLVPATGMLAGALMALGAEPRWVSDWTTQTPVVVLQILAGAVLAASLNAYSNGINQIFDIEVDRINKPWRLLPSGALRSEEAWAISIFFLLLSLALALWVSWQTTLIVGTASALPYLYSAPPARTKGRGFLANITVAIPRGTLLIVAGWSTVKDVCSFEPWCIGAIFGLFMLGAVSTKDFSDIEGDRHCNCHTLPVIYGVRKAIWIISPFLVIPFAWLIPMTLGGFLTGSMRVLIALGLLIPLWGIYIVLLLLRTPPERFAELNRNRSENHPAWKHMYLMAMIAQFGLASAYLIQ